jgi:hypothetical protein
MALQTNRRILKICKDSTISVVGAGTAGCFTALYLADKFPDNKITWVVKSLTNNIGVGEATVPVVQEFLTDLGYDIQYIMRICSGTVKLGVKFINFSDKVFWHPFGNDKSEREELLYICRKNKIPANLLEYPDIATHFDVSMLISNLYSNISNRKNVNVVKSAMESDINILCTGFEENRDFVPADKIINNQAIIYRCPVVNDNDLVPYTTCTGREYGWSWKIPLGNAITYGYVNDGNPKAIDEFKNCLKKENINISSIKPRVLNFKCGRLNQHMTEQNGKIYCRVGLSSCFLEPMEATGLYFIVNSIRTLGDFLLGSIDISSFNEIINNDFDSIYNFIVAHYTRSENSNYYWSKQKTHNYTKMTNNLFPDSSWDYILSGLKHGTPDTIPRGNILNIATGSKYHEWVQGI